VNLFVYESLLSAEMTFFCFCALSNNSSCRLRAARIKSCQRQLDSERQGDLSLVWPNLSRIEPSSSQVFRDGKREESELRAFILIERGKWKLPGDMAR